jgi:hypothetical protein
MGEFGYEAVFVLCEEKRGDLGEYAAFIPSPARVMLLDRAIGAD